MNHPPPENEATSGLRRTAVHLLLDGSFRGGALPLGLGPGRRALRGFGRRATPLRQAHRDAPLLAGVGLPLQRPCVVGPRVSLNTNLSRNVTQKLPLGNMDVIFWNRGPAHRVIKTLGKNFGEASVLTKARSAGRLAHCAARRRAHCIRTFWGGWGRGAGVRAGRSATGVLFPQIPWQRPRGNPSQ